MHQLAKDSRGTAPVAMLRPTRILGDHCRTTSRPIALGAVLLASTAGATPPAFLEYVANQCRFDEALEVSTTMQPPVHEPREIDLLRARLLLHLRRLDEALALEDRWAKDETRAERADRLFLRALSLGAKGLRKDAEAAFEEASKLGADEVLVLGGRGMAAAAAGELGAAEALLQRALAKAPNLSGALYNLACLRSKQGRQDEAAALVRKAWAAGWRDVPTLRTDSWLDGLRKSGLIRDLLATPKAEWRCLTW